MATTVSGAMILAAGLGTRLRPLTDRLAKPMVPVGDRPAIAHVADRLRLVTSRLALNVHHRPHDLADWASTEHVAISEEIDLRGTAGGVSRARSLLGDGDVLVWNADILSDFDPRALTLAAPTTLATLAVRSRPRGEGNVGLGDDGRIVRLRSTRIDDPNDETSGGDFLGIHLLSAEMRANLPERGCLVADVWIPALLRGERLHAHVTTATFVDVGTIAQYLAANRAWLASRSLSSWSAPSAIIAASTSVDGSVIGARARIDAPVLRCVVWPDTHVTSPISDSVATPFAIVGA